MIFLILLKATVRLVEINNYSKKLQPFVINSCRKKGWIKEKLDVNHLIPISVDKSKPGPITTN